MEGRQKIQQLVNDVNSAVQTMEFAKNSLLNTLSSKLNDLLSYIEQLETENQKLKAQLSKADKDDKAE